MSEKPNISDQPLPDADLVPAADASTAVVPVDEAHAHTPPHAPEHADVPAVHLDLHEQLPSAHMGKAYGGYGHDDPASLAGSIKLDLHNPELEHADQQALDQPIWGQPEPLVSPAAAPATPSTDTATAPSWAQLPPVLAHLAQVGLTSSDQWEEQIQPRLQQLNEDIAQVHAQLDVLERQKPKK
jgi:hypothetical protein